MLYILVSYISYILYKHTSTVEGLLWNVDCMQLCCKDIAAGRVVCKINSISNSHGNWTFGSLLIK